MYARDIKRAFEQRGGTVSRHNFSKPTASNCLGAQQCDLNSAFVRW